MTTMTATPRQISYALSLYARNGLTVDKAAEYALLNMTRSQISRRIDELKSRAATRPALEDGMYALDGTIYKVQHAVHGSGNQYAKVLTPNGFEYAPGMVNRLTPADRLTLEAAKAYGALYGTCAVCGRTLTDEGSIAAGIGPVCATRL